MPCQHVQSRAVQDCVLPVNVLLMLGGDTINTVLPVVIPECTTGPSTEGVFSSWHTETYMTSGITILHT